MSFETAARNDLDREERIAKRRRALDARHARQASGSPVQRLDIFQPPAPVDGAEEALKTLVESARDKLPIFARSHPGGLTYHMNEHSGGPAMVMFHASDPQGRFYAHETMTLEEAVRRKIM